VLRFEIARVIGEEFRFAPVAAKIIGLASVLGTMLGCRRIDSHAADGVFCNIRDTASGA
jgi:hypothetical protein